MYDNLATLFYNDVVAAYDDYVKARDSDTSGRNRHTRAAIDFAGALFHFREHWPPHLQKSRAQVTLACTDYRLVADVTNAAKHGTLTRSSSDGPALIGKAEDIEELITVTQYEDAEGMYPDARSEVWINCTDGLRRNLDAALINVLNFWSSELKSSGITAYPIRSAPPPPGSGFILRSDKRVANFEMMKGLDFKQSLRLLQFDSVKGIAVPIDLTGSQLEMKIYKPAHSVDITLTPKEGGHEIRHTVDLTEDEGQTFLMFKSDQERKKFLNEVIKKHTATIEQLVNKDRESEAGD